MAAARFVDILPAYLAIPVFQRYHKVTIQSRESSSHKRRRRAADPVAVGLKEAQGGDYSSSRSFFSRKPGLRGRMV